MIKKMMLLVLVMLCVGSIYAEKAGTLQEVMKPDNITVFENRLYVVEGATIYIYSLDDMKLIKKFGKTGEGPGEMMASPRFPTRIFVSDDYILAEVRSKLVFFSKDGAFIKEKRKINVLSLGYLPFGKHFVSRRLTQGEDKLAYSAICLYDADMKEIKEVYRQKFVQQGGAPSIKLDMVMDFVNYRVHGDKLFVEESSKGFLIEVFDLEGKKLYQINKEYEKIKVTGKKQEELLNRFKEDPAIKAQSTQMGGWSELKKLFEVIYPDTFPAIRSMEISGDKIYIQTYKVEKDRQEYLVMDLKGGKVRKASSPAFEGTPVMAMLLGAKLHTIVDGKLYYLKENEDEEEWDLHIEAVK